MPRVEDLYRSHWATVQAHCRRILRDSDAAEDAAQEIFLRAQNHLPCVTAPEEALRWIYRVATNYCLNQLRNWKSSRERGSQLILPWASPDLAHVLAERSMARWLMGKVPEPIGEVAWLHYVDGMSQQEIADLLRLSRRTVVNRLAHFQRRGRRLVAGPGAADGRCRVLDSTAANDSGQAPGRKPGDRPPVGLPKLAAAKQAVRWCRA